MRFRSGWVLSCSLLLAAEGCRRAADDGDAIPAGTRDAVPAGTSARPGGATADRDRRAAERATRVCQAIQSAPAHRRAACCGGPPSGHVEAQCVRQLSRALAAEHIELDDQKLQSCSEASERAQTGCDWVTPGQPIPPPECRELTRGRVELGGACQSSLECRSPLHCAGSTPSQPGRCASPKPAGEPCEAPADALAAYLFVPDLERAHPSCEGECSRVSHRCEPSAAGSPSAARSDATPDARGSKLEGEACVTDFDCRSGGCAGEPPTCGMKCSISLADMDRFASLPSLGLPRRTRR
jgi:hypothetical protein